MTDQVYTEDQKKILEDIVARALHAGFMGPLIMEEVAVMISCEALAHEWFQHRKGHFGVLEHLERHNIKGAYACPESRQAILYIRVVFPEKFTSRLLAMRPRLEPFLRGYAKVNSKKPTPEMLSGHWSVDKNRLRQVSIKI